MFEKVGLRLFLVRVHRLNKDGAEMRRRCRGRGRLGHCNKLVSAKNSEGDPELVNVDVKSGSV